VELGSEWPGAFRTPRFADSSLLPKQCVFNANTIAANNSRCMESIYIVEQRTELNKERKLQRGKSTWYPLGVPSYALPGRTTFLPGHRTCPDQSEKPSIRQQYAPHESWRPKRCFVYTRPHPCWRGAAPPTPGGEAAAAPPIYVYAQRARVDHAYPLVLCVRGSRFAVPDLFLSWTVCIKTT
jgi:hypothetical protein